MLVTPQRAALLDRDWDALMSSHLDEEAVRTPPERVQALESKGGSR